MEPYKAIVHGGDVRSATGPVLDFSANISPLGLPPSVREALIAGVEENLHYPDPLCRDLRAAIARLEGVPSHHILCGAGAADLIFRLAYGLRPKRALLLAPTFAEYQLALEQAGCECVFHALRPQEGFRPGPSLAEEAAGCDLVMLCNPNNPTGALMEPEGMRRVAAACKAAGAVLAVDECFLDFLPDAHAHTLKPYLAEWEGLVILRAFTKCFALPGLRLGYALCANPELLRKMDEAGPTWNVSVPAQLAGVAAAAETDYLARLKALIQTERPLLQEALAALGLTVYPSAVNYILFRCGCPDLGARTASRGVLIRDCSNYRGLAPGYYRVAVRTGPENRTLAETIGQCL